MVSNLSKLTNTKAFIGNNANSNLVLKASNVSDPSLVLKKGTADVAIPTGDLFLHNGNLHLEKGRLILPNRAHFSAYLSKPTSQVSIAAAQTKVIQLIADKVIADIGNNYNSQTGIFTAPSKDIYRFDCNIQSFLNPLRVGSKVNIFIKIGSTFYKNVNEVSSENADAVNGDYSWSIGITSLMEAFSTAYCGLEFVVSHAQSAQLSLQGSESISLSRFSGTLLS